MATFSSIISELGARSENKLVLWAEINPTTFRYTTVNGYAITATGTVDQEGIFTGGATFHDPTETQLAELTTVANPEYTGLLRWVHTNARRASVTIDQIIENFAAELDA